MEKALRRQAGADVIRLDTVEAFAHYALREPQQIDFFAIEQAAKDAIYTITSLTLTVEGTVVRPPARTAVRTGRTLNSPVPASCSSSLATSRWGAVVC